MCVCVKLIEIAKGGCSLYIGETPKLQFLLGVCGDGTIPDKRGPLPLSQPMSTAAASRAPPIAEVRRIREVLANQPWGLAQHHIRTSRRGALPKGAAVRLPEALPTFSIAASAWFLYVLDIVLQKTAAGPPEASSAYKTTCILVMR